jgi:tRNA(Ile)-lysidine synthetase-like protein
VIRHALRLVRGDLRRVERSHVEQLEQQLDAGKNSGPIPLPGTAVAYCYRGTLFAFPGPLPPAPTGAGQPVAEGPGRWRARFAALGAVAEIRAEEGETISDLELRARRPGDRLLGSDRKLKELLSGRGVPRPYRDFVPVLAIDEWVVACPGLVSSRLGGAQVRWVLDSRAPFLDIDFPLHI